jgi:hypothetical protein
MMNFCLEIVILKHVSVKIIEDALIKKIKVQIEKMYFFF